MLESSRIVEKSSDDRFSIDSFLTVCLIRLYSGVDATMGLALLRKASLWPRGTQHAVYWRHHPLIRLRVCSCIRIVHEQGFQS
jgi:hypothetical protein